MIAFIMSVALSIAAPVPKEADEQFEKSVNAAREKAIEFLKKQQDKDGSWEGVVLNLLADMEGGTTALATLSLLEAGVPANDPAVAKAVAYLVKLEPKKTYVVSLQTQVLCRVDAKKHAKQIQTNADWLIENAIGLQKGELAGWSYPGNQIADNSNTHFAVVGLHAAAQAGAKIDAKVWEQIRDYYIRTQLNGGGWAYYNGAQFGGKASNSMTACALLGLTIAAKYDKNAKGPYPAYEKGLKLLVPWKDDSTKSKVYSLMVAAELGRLRGVTEFKVGDKTWAWYRDGAEKLVKVQKEDGSLVFDSGIDANPVLATAHGLYFLGPPPAKK
jgi:Prenyltransferase and squalene oxidase repeat